MTGEGAPLRARLALGLEPRLLAAACLTGAIAGGLAALYFETLSGALRLFAFFDAHAPVYVLMPAAGVLVGACYWLGHPGETDAVVDNIHVQNGRIDARALLPLIPCSLLSIAAGGSAGPEAPMVYLTGTVGSFVQKWLRVPEREVRALTFAGMSVGFASLLCAPVGSAIFALEIPHRRGMEYYEATVPALVGCLSGYAVFAALTGHGIGALWHFPGYTFARAGDLALAVLVGAVGSAAAFVLVGLIRACGAGARALRAPMWLTAALGGLVLGLLAWRWPGTRFWSEEQLQKFVVDPVLAPRALMALALAKMLAVAVTLGSGWRGGIILPCFFIGACLGKALAIVCPGLDPTLAMLCGMAAVNTGVMKVPLATLLVVTAMCGVAALPPVAAAAFTSFVLTGGVGLLRTQRSRAVEAVAPG